MTEAEARKKYAEEPRYQSLVDWVRGKVLAGSYTGKELVWAAMLGAELAEADRRKIPDRPVPTVTDLPKAAPPRPRPDS